MTAYIFDNYAWVEYLIGSRKGAKVRKLIENKNTIFTIVPCLAELNGWALKNNQAFSLILKVIRANSTTIPLTEQDWITAGEERFNQRKKQADFGLIDAAILVKQKETGAKIVSGDKHFKTLPHTIFLC